MQLTDRGKAGSLQLCRKRMQIQHIDKKPLFVTYTLQYNEILFLAYTSLLQYYS